MDIQKEKLDYTAMLVAEDALTQDQCDTLKLNIALHMLYSYRLPSATIDCINWGWSAWLKAKAKAEKALLEQFEINNKLVEQIEKLKDQAKDTERLNFLLAGEHIRTVVKRDIENDDYEVVGSHYLFTELYWIDGFDYYENTSAHSERDAIDKAMIEAQEQSHD